MKQQTAPEHPHCNKKPQFRPEREPLKACGSAHAHSDTFGVAARGYCVMVTLAEGSVQKAPFATLAAFRASLQRCDRGDSL